MMGKSEMETHLSMTGDDHSEWILFTDDPYMIRHMGRLGIEPTKQVGEGYQYRLSADQVLIRRGKRQLSDATRHAMAARLQNSRTTESFTA